MFDDETNMVRIDMSEYMEKHSVARRIACVLHMLDEEVTAHRSSTP